MVAFYAFITFSAFCASMTVLGAWLASELRKRGKEYVL